jgi:hypothetical protein
MRGGVNVSPTPDTVCCRSARLKPGRGLFRVAVALGVFHNGTPFYS